jgi:hypothetical protein
MKNRKFIIVGLILFIIGFSGGIYAGNIVIDNVIKSAEESKSYSALAANGTPPATAQMVVAQEISIFVGIIGFGLLTHGLVNRSDEKVAPMQSKSYT